MGLSRDAVASWLTASCAEQGVPVLITDPHVLAKVAALLAPPEAAGRETARSAGRGRSRTRSNPPDGPHSTRIQGPAAGLARSDHDVVEHG